MVSLKRASLLCVVVLSNALLAVRPFDGGSRDQNNPTQTGRINNPTHGTVANTVETAQYAQLPPDNFRPGYIVSESAEIVIVDNLAQAGDAFSLTVSNSISVDLKHVDRATKAVIDALAERGLCFKRRSGEPEWVAASRAMIFALVFRDSDDYTVIWDIDEAAYNKRADGVAGLDKTSQFPNSVVHYFIRAGSLDLKHPKLTDSLGFTRVDKTGAGVENLGVRAVLGSKVFKKIRANWLAHTKKSPNPVTMSHRWVASRTKDNPDLMGAMPAAAAAVMPVLTCGQELYSFSKPAYGQDVSVHMMYRSLSSAVPSGPLSLSSMSFMFAAPSDCGKKVRVLCLGQKGIGIDGGDMPNSYGEISSNCPVSDFFQNMIEYCGLHGKTPKEWTRQAFQQKSPFFLTYQHINAVGKLQQTVVDQKTDLSQFDPNAKDGPRSVHQIFVFPFSLFLKSDAVSQRRAPGMESRWFDFEKDEPNPHIWVAELAAQNNSAWKMMWTAAYKPESYLQIKGI